MTYIDNVVSGFLGQEGTSSDKSSKHYRRLNKRMKAESGMKEGHG